MKCLENTLDRTANDLILLFVILSEEPTGVTF